jgi:fumarate reductase subunit D
VIVLDKNDGVGDVLDFLEDRVGKLAVYVLIVLPVGGAKERTSVRDMAERPEAFVGKAVVVAFFLFLG